MPEAWNATPSPAVNWGPYGLTPAQVAAVGPVVVTLNSTAAAAANTAAIQAALSATGVVQILSATAGICWINATLRIGSNTSLIVGPLITIKAMPGATGNLLTTLNYTAVATAIIVAWTAATIEATVTWTAHGLTLADRVWLYGNTDSALIGVFDIKSIVDANNVIVLLKRLPAANGGSNLAKKAHRGILVSGGTWNYNSSGGNTGSNGNTDLHTTILAGVYDLSVRDMSFYDGAKFYCCLGAVSKFEVSNVSGDGSTSSDLVKVYGPAYNGTVRRTGGVLGDDVVSLQTREPAAYAAYRWTYGDVFDVTCTEIGGESSTGAVLLYPSANEQMDGIVIDGLSSAVYTSTYVMRIDNAEAGTTGNVGTIVLRNARFFGRRSAIALGNANSLAIKNLVLDNPVYSTSGNVGRLFDTNGALVTANITINGGYIGGCDNIVTTGNATNSALNLTLRGTVIGATYSPFSFAAPGTHNILLDNVIWENNPGNFMFNLGAASPTIRLAVRDGIYPSNGITLNSSGSPVLNCAGINLVQTPAFSAAPTWDFFRGQIIVPAVLTANVTAITLSRIPQAGQQVFITLQQDATAGRTVTWPASVIFPAVWVDAVITTDANKKCTVGFVSNGTQLVAQGANKWA